VLLMLVMAQVAHAGLPGVPLSVLRDKAPIVARATRGPAEAGERCSTNTTYHHHHHHDEAAKTYVGGDG